MKLAERGRGKFRPTSDYTIDDVRKVLFEKIEEETMNIIDDEDDLSALDQVKYDPNKFNVISLFSGCGGLDLGFELAGLIQEIGYENAMRAFDDKDTYKKVREQSIFHTLYTNDIFKEAEESYKLNFPETAVHQLKDIRKIRHFPKADLILGGFPCPGFSEAGPRLVDDARNFLYLHFIRCIMQAQPDVFVAENVKGMLTLGKGEVIKQISQDFASAGYDVQYKLLNARDYGVPQLRERVFIIGTKKGLGFKYKYPEATHGDKAHQKPHVSLEDAIGDLQGDPGPYFTGSFSSMYLSRNRKKKWSEQSFTIQASGRQAPLHPSGPDMNKLGPDQWELPGDITEHRRMSVREAARIQTFPDWFQFSNGGKSGVSENNLLDKQYKQIGNAVPVLLAQAVAGPIAEWASKHVKERNKDDVFTQISMF
ncbi:modification methylase [Jeotgalibacillus malaysiensis]|uniref:Cytosine-specific methyltransferase n=1 Tax=Jeotgalibacillus malaysiensis TaxID=1508404 RepID=A0A0B5AWA6_9BACL|nr:DNA cytosine methyltransferase [Jeotgalibacillus malaysiensis]AJD92853.1 modification methylase [Jeotgalibacillus malaysiensis]